MDRRTFIGSIAGGLVAVPLKPLAQQRERPWRIGYLSPVQQADSTALLAPLSAAFRELGYVDGHTAIATCFRSLRPSWSTRRLTSSWPWARPRSWRPAG
jgi:hypothetical protein